MYANVCTYSHKTKSCFGEIKVISFVYISVTNNSLRGAGRPLELGQRVDIETKSPLLLLDSLAALFFLLYFLRFGDAAEIYNLCCALAGYFAHDKKRL